jgi:hypothetical protein
MKPFVVGLLLGILGTGLLGSIDPAASQQPGITRFRAVEIVDTQGRVRGTFGMNSRTETISLSLADADGRSRAELNVLSSGLSELVFRSLDGRVRFTITSLLGGSTELVIRDGEGHTLFRAP